MRHVRNLVRLDSRPEVARLNNRDATSRPSSFRGSYSTHCTQTSFATPIFPLLILTLLAFTSCNKTGNENITNGSYDLKVNIISGNKQIVGPGFPYQQALNVQVVTRSDNTPVPGLQTSFQETTNTGTVLSKNTITTDANGMATIRATAPSSFGQNISIQAAVSGTDSANAFSLATYTEEKYYHITLTTTNDLFETAGVPFNFIISVKNPEGNLVTNYNKTRTFTLNTSASESWAWSGVSTDGYQIPSTLTCVFVNGICTSPTTNVLTDARKTTLVTISDTPDGFDSISKIPVSLQTNAISPTQLAFSTLLNGPTGVGGVAGVASLGTITLVSGASPITRYLAIVDAAGNFLSNVTTGGISVTAETPASTITNNITIGTNSFTFTPRQVVTGIVRGIYSGVQTDLTLIVVPGALDHFVVTTQHSGTEAADTPFQITLQAQDANNNNITTYNQSPTLSYSVSNSANTVYGFNSQVPASGAVAFSNGTATISGFQLFNASTTPHIIVRQSGSQVGDSGAITVTAGAKSRVGFSAPPSTSATAGVSFVTQPTVQIQDAYGNLVTTATDNVTLLPFTDSSCAVPATSGTLTTNASATQGPAVAGVVAFSGVSYTKIGSLYLKATSGSLTASECSLVPPSSAFSTTILPADPAQLVYSTQPSTTATAGVPFAIQPVVQVLDAFSNLVSSATTAVTVGAYTNALCTIAAPGNISATTNPLNASSGVATFSDVEYDTPGTIYLGATSGSLTKACSSSAITVAASTNTLVDNSSALFGQGSGNGTAVSSGTETIDTSSEGRALPNCTDTHPWMNTSNLIFLAHFEETGSPASFADSSCGTAGSNYVASGTHNLTPVGSYTAGATGKIGNGLNPGSNFNGITSILYTGTTNITEMVWVKPTGQVSAAAIYNGNGGNAGYGIIVNKPQTDGLLPYNDNSGSMVNFFSGGQFIEPGDHPVMIPFNAWTHLALVISITGGQGDWNIYVNGEHRTRRYPSSASNPTLGLLVGNGFNPGTVDEAAFFSRALSASEIQAIYRHQVGAYGGSFYSRVMDATTSAPWNVFSWLPNAPYHKELPDFGQQETGYSSGNVNMTSNTLLYHMNETSWAGGGPIVIDSSGSGNTGSPVGTDIATTAGTNTGGKFNGAGIFSNSPITSGTQLANYITLSDPPTLGTGDFTIEAWIQSDATTAGTIMAYGATSANNGLKFYIGTDKKLHTDLSGGSSTTSGATVMDNQWHHVAVVYSSGSQLLQNFIDGQPSGIPGTSIAPTILTGNAYIGQDLSSHDLFYGTMDEVAVYSRALTATEISNRFLRGALRVGFQMRSCSANDCSDQAGNSNLGFMGGDSFSFSSTGWLSELFNPSILTPAFALNSLTNNRYFQYRMVLETDVTTASPQIVNVSALPGTTTDYATSAVNAANYTTSSAEVTFSGSIAKLNLPRMGNDHTTFGSTLGIKGFDTYRSIAGVTVAGDLVTMNTGGTATNNSELSSDWTPQYSSIVNYWNLNGSGALGATITAQLPAASTSPVGNGSGTVAYGTGKMNTAVTFNGSGDFIGPITAGVPMAALSRSVSVWVYPTSSADGVVFYWGTGTTDQGYGVQLKPGSGTILHYGVSDDFSCNVNIITNSWMHIVTTFDGTNGGNTKLASIYVNGSLCASQVKSSWSTTGTSNYFINGDGTSAGMVGTIDEFAVWSKALTASEVALIYNRQSPTYSGTFNSRVMDGGGSVTWNTLSWITSSILNYTIPDSGTTGLRSGLTGLWHLNDTVGPAVDTSGSGYNLAANGGVTFSQTGKLGNAISFDGSTGYLQSTVSNITRSAAISASMWIKPATTSGGGFFAAGPTACCTPAQHFRVYQYAAGTAGACCGLTDPPAEVLNNPGIALSLFGHQANVEGTAFITPGSWHHVAVSLDASGLLYISIDGQFPPGDTYDTGFTGQAHSQPLTLNANFASTGPVSIGYALGTLPTSVPAYFNGAIDEVAMWNRALTKEEMVELYQVNRVKFRARSCTASDCSDDSTGANWKGPDATNGTYFTDSNNTISSQTSGTITFGSCTGCTGGLTLGGNPYAQYQMVLEGAVSSPPIDPPTVTFASLGPNFSYYPYFYTKNGTAYTLLLGFNVTYGSNGCNAGARFDITNDATFTNWYSWNGSAWTLNSNGYFGANSESTVDNNIAKFPTDVGTGSLYVRGYLASDGSAATGACEIQNIRLFSR